MIKPMKYILTVEDEATIRAALKRLLENNGYYVLEAATVQEALALLKTQPIDLVISDLRLPGAPGTDLIQQVGDIPVLIMTSYASLRSAIDSMKIKAVDYIAKPFDHDELLATISRILEQHSLIASEEQTSEPSTNAAHGIIGKSQAIRKIFEQIEKVAPVDCNVLIQGETGTGKELIARAIHQLSGRHKQAMI